MNRKLTAAFTLGAYSLYVGLLTFWVVSAYSEALVRGRSPVSSITSADSLLLGFSPLGISAILLPAVTVLCLLVMLIFCLRLRWLFLPAAVAVAAFITARLRYSINENEFWRGVDSMIFPLLLGVLLVAVLFGPTLTGKPFLEKFTKSSQSSKKFWEQITGHGDASAAEQWQHAAGILFYRSALLWKAWPPQLKKYWLTKYWPSLALIMLGVSATLILGVSFTHVVIITPFSVLAVLAAGAWVRRPTPPSETSSEIAALQNAGMRHTLWALRALFLVLFAVIWFLPAPNPEAHAASAAIWLAAILPLFIPLTLVRLLWQVRGAAAAKVHLPA